MRIIAGKHKKRIILMVGNPKTRETSDRIRESVFNMLGGTLLGSVLDLFAGSGAYALEALSRGASHATAVDHHKEAYLTIKENAKRLNETHQMTIVLSDYSHYIKSLDETTLFDYIFIDPPYEMHIYHDVIKCLEKNLNPEGIMIVESEKKVPFDELIGTLKIIKEKTYGFKKITLYKKGA